MKKTEAAEAAWQIRRLRLAGRASTRAAPGSATATGSNRVVFGPKPKWVSDGGGDEEAMPDVYGGEEARNNRMAETETATETATDTKTETETGSLATNQLSDPALRCKVIQMGHCGA